MDVNVTMKPATKNVNCLYHSQIKLYKALLYLKNASTASEWSTLTENDAHPQCKEILVSCVVKV